MPFPTQVVAAGIVSTLVDQAESRTAPEHEIGACTMWTPGAAPHTHERGQGAS